MKSLILILSMTVFSAMASAEVDLSQLKGYETASCFQANANVTQGWSVNVYTKNFEGYAVVMQGGKVIDIVNVAVADYSTETFGVVKGKEFSLSIDQEDYNFGRMEYKGEVVTFGDVDKVECTLNADWDANNIVE